MKKINFKLLLFGDYIINIVVSFIGILVLSFVLKFDWGYYLHGAIFTLTLFLFIYPRLYLAGKIDARGGNMKLINAVKIALPLAVTGLVIIFAYALIYYKIIPAGDIVLREVTNSTGEVSKLLVLDIVQVFVRICFFNLSGFCIKGSITPLVPVINIIVTFAASLVGYYCGANKIYISDYINLFSKKVKDKFDE